MILGTLSVILYLFHSLSLCFSSLLRAPPSSERASSRKRLQYNSRCRGWGPHLGDIASLIPYCSWAGSALLYPLLLPSPKRKHCSHSWVSGMFNYLVKAQKGFWCLRIKVCVTGGIGSHISKLCRCCKGVWTKTLMGVLLSRGWNFPPVTPALYVILSILIWFASFTGIQSHPSVLILSLLMFWFHVCCCRASIQWIWVELKGKDALDLVFYWDICSTESHSHSFSLLLWFQICYTGTYRPDEGWGLLPLHYHKSRRSCCLAFRANVQQQHFKILYLESSAGGPKHRQHAGRMESKILHSVKQQRVQANQTGHLDRKLNRKLDLNTN